MDAPRRSLIARAGHIGNTPLNSGIAMAGADTACVICHS